MHGAEKAVDSKPPSSKDLANKDPAPDPLQRSQKAALVDDSRDDDQPVNASTSSLSSDVSTSSSHSESSSHEDEDDDEVDLEKQALKRSTPQVRSLSNLSNLTTTSYRYPLEKLGVRLDTIYSATEDASTDNASTSTTKLQRLLEDYIDMETKFRQEQRKHQETMREKEKLQMQLTGTIEVELSDDTKPASSTSTILSSRSVVSNILCHTLASDMDEKSAASSSSSIESKASNKSSNSKKNKSNHKSRSDKQSGVDSASGVEEATTPDVEHPNTKKKTSEDDNKTENESDGSDSHSECLMVQTFGSHDISLLLAEEADPDDPAMAEHLGDSRQYWRDIILGVNDGLVSTFLLVAGVAGGGLSTLDILLTAIAGAVAGAVSMCAGEYVATKSQNEVIDGEIKMEEKHIQKYPREELREVAPLLELIGITDMDRSLQKQLVKHYAKDRDALLQLMVVLELGFLEDEQRSPVKAGFVSFFLFIAGAIPSVLPFTIDGIDPTSGLIVAAVATSTALLIVGAVKTWASKGNCFSAALENLIVAGFGGAIAYCTGLLTERVLRSS
ncbi:Vacuolar iron transporter 1 [Seminavis robusta]|uniref:Vacuolar iron transporter 1 n=1 Tax=Seminavis robusta TaxID=568900 RepID=A0A9N8E5U1_9STRA|nr:Vacuolar iron transporter 1 [Seminavis robusta]|eukprot:Sro528_g160830.1 Vacuolar iron transporter 1 (559) ;mRNA; r:27040-29040